MCGSRHGNGVGEEQRRQSGKGASSVTVSLCHCVTVFHVSLCFVSSFMFGFSCVFHVFMRQQIMKMVCRVGTTQRVLCVCHVYFYIHVFHLCFKCCSQVLHGVSQM